MSQLDRLARALVDTAFELHRRRLWLQAPGDGLFLVRIPDQPHPFVATIIGQLGSNYGLILACGEHALDEFVHSIATRASGLRSVGVLSVTMGSLGSIPPHMRGVIEAAGFQARREALAPFFMAKTADLDKGRAPSRSEQRVLLAVMRGVLLAHDAGELRVAEFSATPKRLLEITVTGEGRDLSASTRTVRVDVAAVRSATASLSLPPDLPRLDERWVAGTVLDEGLGPADVDEIAVVVINESKGLAIAHCAASSDEPDAIPKLFAALLRGEWERQGPGFPREVLFTDSRIQVQVEPMLRDHGVQCSLIDHHELIDEYADLCDTLLADALRQEPQVAKTDSLPTTLEGWKAADLELTRQLCDLVDGQSKSKSIDRAIARYFGTTETGVEVLSTLQQFQPLGAFMEWRLADYRPTARSKTFLEKQLQRKDLCRVERALIEARLNARLSIYRIVATRPGESLDVEDIFDGCRFTVHDRSLSGCDVEGGCIPMRLMTVSRWLFPAFAGPAMTTGDVDRATRFLESCGFDLSRESIRLHPQMLGWIWQIFLPRNRPQITLTNTDGDLLLWHTATFRLADPIATARGLHAKEKVNFDEVDGTWTWWKPGGPSPGFGDNTTLGSIEIHDQRLVLEVNSAARFARARTWIEALPGGVEFERVTTREVKPGASPLDDRLPSKRQTVSPELIERIAKMHRESCMRWLDERVPALGNRTPRQVATTEAGRQRVAVMIRTMPAISSQTGPIEPPREEMLRAIGVPVSL
ncbi:MAG: DUF2384 domain-containing protein [Planctomycetes bacterium]|nr:DUF2384 domain-containing protein [Planctomycetota bacterium]